MNIGLFTDTYFPQINGVGTSVHTLASALEKLGHTVTIFTPSDPKADKNETNVIRMPSMPFLLLRNFRVGLIYPPLALKRITDLKLDIVHTQTEFSLGIFGKTFSKAFHVPMVHTYHTMYEDYVHYIANGALVTPAMAKEFSKLFCNGANAVIAPTEKVKHFLLEYGVKKTIHIIPTGIDTKLFQKSNFKQEDILAVKEELNLSPNAPVILSLGRVAKEKSIDVVIRAMPKLLQKLPYAVLVIVGDGPVREELEHLTASLGITKSVRFTGAKPWNEIGIYYQLGDVFVSASVTETQGLTFAEAMAGGIAVVAKKDESIENLVKDNETGILFEHDEELADKLYDILTDKEKYNRLVKASIEAMEALSVETFAKNVEALYKDIVANPEKYNYHASHHYTKLSFKLGKKAVSGLRGISGNIAKKGRYVVNAPKRVFTTFAYSKIRKNEIDTIDTDKEEDGGTFQ